MSPNFRKVALIAASLGLVVSLFVALRDDEDDAGTTSAATTVQATTGAPATSEEPPATTEEEPPATTEEPPATTEEPPPTTTVPPPDRVITIAIAVVGGRPEGGIRRASVRRGREVVLRVTSDVADHIHLHGYDLIADVAPGAPAEIAFVASVPGRFEVELEDRGVHIADLEVRP